MRRPFVPGKIGERPICFPENFGKNPFVLECGWAEPMGMMPPPGGVPNCPPPAQPNPRTPGPARRWCWLRAGAALALVLVTRRRGAGA